MAQTDFVKKLKNNDTNAYNSIIEVFKAKGITELDISNKDDKYDDVHAYCYNDDCYCADNIKLDKIVLNEGCLSFIDDGGFEYSMKDFHDGTMPYIYSNVMQFTDDMPDVKATKFYEVQIYYHGCYSTSVEATSENEAFQIVREQASSLPDLDFLYAIELQYNGHDVFTKRQINITNK
jgi:hypothetical protein